MTLFSKSFELDVVSRIWDTLLFEGEFFIIKVGIGLFFLFIILFILYFSN